MLDPCLNDDKLSKTSLPSTTWNIFRDCTNWRISMKVSLVVRLTLYFIWLFKDRWFTDARSGLYPLIGTGHADRLERDAGRV